MRHFRISRTKPSPLQPCQALQLVLLSLGLISNAATAQTPASGTETSGTAAGQECYCRAGGKIYAMGQQICLAIAGQPGLYRCEMEQNVTNWKALGEPCPQS